MLISILFCFSFFLSDDFSQYERSGPFVSHVHVSQATLAALVAAGDLHFTLVIPPGSVALALLPPRPTPRFLLPLVQERASYACCHSQSHTPLDADDSAVSDCDADPGRSVDGESFGGRCRGPS